MSEPTWGDTHASEAKRELLAEILAHLREYDPCADMGVRRSIADELEDRFGPAEEKP